MESSKQFQTVQGRRLDDYNVDELVMLSEYHRDDEADKSVGQTNDGLNKLFRTENNDFSLARCRPEKLQEQMTVEKAATILKIPTGRSGNISDRDVLNKKFMNLVHRRLKIPSDDPEYDRKIENRHVLEVLAHESYQFMTKNGRWRDQLDVIGDGNQRLEKVEKKLDNDKDRADSLQFEKVEDFHENLDIPLSPTVRTETGMKTPTTSLELRRAIVKQEEKERSKNILLNRMIENYLTEENDPVLNPEVKRKPRIAILD